MMNEDVPPMDRPQRFFDIKKKDREFLRNDARDVGCVVKKKGKL